MRNNKTHKSRAMMVTRKKERGCVQDAAYDQDGNPWIRYGLPDDAIWFALADLQSSEQEVIKRLVKVRNSKPLLTTASKNAFRNEIENHDKYRDAVVADAPGWLNGNYVFPDGSICSPDGRHPEIIIGFEKDTRFQPKGSLARWQTGIAPIVADEPIPLTVLCAQLVGPLLTFLPKSYDTNPIIELSGPTERGKSAIVTGSYSIWAGDDTSTEHGADTWDMTVGGVNKLKRAHRDGSLVFNEGNLGDQSPKVVGEKRQQAYFKLSTSAERLNERKTRSQHSRVVTLSTVNIHVNRLDCDPGVSDAVLSRVICIDVPDHGVLSRVPEGFSSSADAMEHFIEVASDNHGVVIRALIEKAFMKNSIWKVSIPFMAKIFRMLLQKRGRTCPARIEKSFSILLTAGFLARITGVFPPSFGDLIGAILQVFDSLTEKKPKPAITHVQKYRAARKGIIKLRNLGAPLSRSQFLHHPGALTLVDGRKALLVPSGEFQKFRPNYVSVVQKLRQENLAKTEDGLKKKLTIKAPRRFCKTGRVYCFFLP